MNTEQKTHPRPQVMWIPVQGSDGRVHMEAHWELRRAARQHAA